MRTIIVPVNFSKNSTNAAHYAADLARTIGAELNLVHVFQAPMVIPEVPIPENVLEEMRDTNLSLLKDLAADLRKRTDDKIKVSIDMKIGATEKKIESFCQNKKTHCCLMQVDGNLFHSIAPPRVRNRLTGNIPHPPGGLSRARE